MLVLNPLIRLLENRPGEKTNYNEAHLHTDEQPDHHPRVSVIHEKKHLQAPTLNNAPYTLRFG